MARKVYFGLIALLTLPSLAAIAAPSNHKHAAALMQHSRAALRDRAKTPKPTPTPPADQSKASK